MIRSVGPPRIRVMVRVISVLALALALVALGADTALAHEGQVIRLGSFLGGLTHPVLGLDHLLAMLSVGVVSAQLGGRAIWTVPTTFVVVMALGGLVGRTGVGPGMSAVELGIALSVLALGVVIAADRRLPVLVVMGAVALFASFHGYAHGIETPDIANAGLYAGGFLTGTALIHLLGVLIGDVAGRYKAGRGVLRFGGAAVSTIGALFLMGII